MDMLLLRWFVDGDNGEKCAAVMDREDSDCDSGDMSDKGWSGF